MKNFIKIIVLPVILLIGFTNLVFSQREPGWQKTGQRFFEAQLAQIRTQLNLNEQTAVKVEVILRSYNMEVERARRMEFLGKRTNADTLSDSVAEKMILNQINSSRKFLQLREKYYYELKKIISPKEILEIYRIEQEVNRKIMLELNKRKSENINH